MLVTFGFLPLATKRDKKSYYLPNDPWPRSAGNYRACRSFLCSSVLLLLIILEAGLPSQKRQHRPFRPLECLESGLIHMVQSGQRESGLSRP